MEPTKEPITFTSPEFGNKSTANAAREILLNAAAELEGLKSAARAAGKIAGQQITGGMDYWSLLDLAAHLHEVARRVTP